MDTAWFASDAYFFIDTLPYLMNKRVTGVCT